MSSERSLEEMHKALRNEEANALKLMDEYKELLTNSFGGIFAEFAEGVEYIQNEFDSFADMMKKKAIEEIQRRGGKVKKATVKKEPNDGEKFGTRHSKRQKIGKPSLVKQELVKAEPIEGAASATNEGVINTSNPVYTVKNYDKKTILEYKGSSYETGKIKDGAGMDCPPGKYRCVRQKKKCSGTIEPVLEGGTVKIRECNEHSCIKRFFE